jgi:two-component system, cell cycle sensor histidine kinase and response regulator CckA
MIAAPSDLPSHDGTLLLVDDDDAVRRVLARMLRGAGYLVHDYSSGESAVEFVRCHAGPIDLLVTDTVLPGMSGIEAAEAIRRLRPTLPVLQMSGYMKRDVSPPEDCAYHFIAKPFRGDQLVRCVRTIIGSPAHVGAGSPAV